ncbi:aldo/keto reductase [Mycetocola sp. JXN-3]|uniref:aldo/keto reductase n=1 Tax=Mycetocola sp. JXN-3 TaxID=2116510 RepID=UPI00165D021E|nr:aldo/keto reductase [Mycetocola sp. JXN-3]
MTSRTLTIGSSHTVTRIGFGAMQLTGEQVWGPYPDHAGGLALLRALREEGVDFIDTADVYGPHHNESLIREALHPYPGLTIASKGGFVRGGFDYDTLGWVGNPIYLRQSAVMSASRLGLDALPLYYLHNGYATDAPFEDQVGALRDLRDEGLIQNIGLSNVTAEQYAIAREIAPIAATTAMYNAANRTGGALMRATLADGGVFSPWWPMSLRKSIDDATPIYTVLDPIAAEHGITTGQLALAWLLHLDERILPIPGTTSRAHLRENMAALDVVLSEDEIAAISALVSEPAGGAIR